MENQGCTIITRPENDCSVFTKPKQKHFGTLTASLQFLGFIRRGGEKSRMTKDVQLLQGPKMIVQYSQDPNKSVLAPFQLRFNFWALFIEELNSQGGPRVHQYYKA